MDFCDNVNIKSILKKNTEIKRKEDNMVKQPKEKHEPKLSVINENCSKSIKKSDTCNDIENLKLETKEVKSAMSKTQPLPLILKKPMTPLSKRRKKEIKRRIGPGSYNLMQYSDFNEKRGFTFGTAARFDYY